MDDQERRRVRVIVDRERCKSVRMCIAFAPNAFALDEDSLSTFLPDGDWTLEQLEEAVDNCPNEKLTLVVDEP